MQEALQDLCPSTQRRTELINTTNLLFSFNDKYHTTYHLNIVLRAVPDQAMNEGRNDCTATITPHFYHCHHAVRIDIWFQQREQQWYVRWDRAPPHTRSEHSSPLCVTFSTVIQSFILIPSPNDQFLSLSLFRLQKLR